MAVSNRGRNSSAHGMRARAGPSCSAKCSPRRLRRVGTLRPPRLAARRPCGPTTAPEARPLAQGCPVLAREEAPSARGRQGERLRRGGPTARAATCAKSPSSLPVDLPGTSGLPRHKPRLTAASPLARHRPPPGAAHGRRAEPRARRRRGAGDGAWRWQGATGRARGVHSETAVVKRQSFWLYYACTCTCTNI